MNDDPNNIEREIAKMKARADEAEKRGQAERRDDKTAKGKGGSPPDLRSAAKDWRAQRGNANPPRPNGGEGDDAPTVAVLLVVSAASFAGKPVPARRWIVPDIIPDRTVTSLGGDGGVGKSIVALQLAVAAAAGCEWIGTLPEQGSVVFVSAEDDIDELHRRLDGIAAKLGVALTNLADLHIIPLAGRDAIMGATEGKTGIVKATAVWRGLVEIIEQIRPRLVILDVLADVFAGNENARPEARQFIGLLRGLAIDHALAVVLLAHPSLTGMNTGSGTSGSTAWSNSVRSRLYLETIKGDDGKEIDANLRILRVKKANYGRVGLELRLRWENLCFSLDMPTGGFNKLATEAKAERVFLDLLATYAAQGRDVSDSPGANYAPSEFERQGADPQTKAALKGAMKRLLLTGQIRVETFGPPSRTRKRIVIEPSKEREP